MSIIKIPKAAKDKFYSNQEDIFKSGNLAEGPWNAKLAKYVAKYARAEYATPFCSNGAALLAILILLRRYRNYQDVFIQTNTMYGVKTLSVSSGLNLVGAVPCSRHSLMPTIGSVTDFVNKLEDPSKSVFIMSHIGGIINPDIVAIADLCKNLGIALIEDCAHSFGATLAGIHSGNFGLAGVYSLYSTKAVAAGEGGITITNDPELGDQLSRFVIYDRFEQNLEVGVNFRVSEVQALFAFCVVEQVEHIISNKAKVARKYSMACNELGVGFVDPFANQQRGNHYKFTLLARGSARKEFVNITSRTSSVYDYSLGKDPDNVIDSHICVPIWYDLTPIVVEQTLEQIFKIQSQ
jgi:dTDP-4-amino-4,6-dideoxygalactose transaminase